MTVADMKKEAAEHLKRFQQLKAEIADAERLMQAGDDEADPRKRDRDGDL